MNTEARRKYRREYMREWRKSHPRSAEQNVAHNTYMREWEANNKEKVTTRRAELYAGKSMHDRSAANLKCLAARRAALAEIKMRSGCVDCGYNKHPHALQFDHLPQYEKSFGIAREVTHKSLDKLLEEAAKCEVRCANCHAIKTTERRTALKSTGVH